MKKVHEIEMTVERLDRLMKELRKLPEKPIGRHLSADEFVRYSMRSAKYPMKGGERKRIDKHLSSCPHCGDEMEFLMEADKYRRSKEGKRRLKALQKRLLDSLKEPPASSPARKK